MLNTVAELPTYRALAEKHLSDAERQAIISYLAEHPLAGGRCVAGHWGNSQVALGQGRARQKWWSAGYPLFP